MKFNGKALLGILLVGVIMFIAVHLLYGDSYKLLSGDVLNNQEEMTQLAEALLKGEETELYDKYDITYDISVWNTEDIIVQFLLPTESEGVAPASKYVGVYYSPDDVVTGFQGVIGTHQPDGEGWSWSEGSNGDNGGYTQKITDNWYYFEAWF